MFFMSYEKTVFLIILEHCSQCCYIFSFNFFLQVVIYNYFSPFYAVQSPPLPPRYAKNYRHFCILAALKFSYSIAKWLSFVIKNLNLAGHIPLFKITNKLAGI